jgi:hypothetical protein
MTGVKIITSLRNFIPLIFNTQLKLKSLMTNDEFFTKLAHHFPFLSDILEEDSSMIHFKLERFAEYTIDQIINNNLPELNRCFSFLEARIGTMSPELINALNVSYFEALLLGEAAYKMPEITALMPPKLVNGYVSYEKYYQELWKKSKNN